MQVREVPVNSIATRMTGRASPAEYRLTNFYAIQFFMPISLLLRQISLVLPAMAIVPSQLKSPSIYGAFKMRRP
jgi:hypothetical protein